MRSLLLLSLLLGLSVAKAATITIDFTDPGIPDDGLEEGFVTQGFSFTFSSLPPGTAAFIHGIDSLGACPGCDMAMENAGGAIFSLHSFSAASFPVGDLNIQVTGFLDGGGTLTETVPTSGNFQLYELDWDGLTRVEFDPNFSVSADSFSPTIFKDIVVSAIPIPAAVWLFGSALAGLGWLRRKQTV